MGLHLKTSPAETAVDPTSSPRRIASPAAFFWAAAAALTLLAYWICLRYLLPGYFAPLSPFHADFYEYTGSCKKTILQLLLHYPRPAAYLSMRALAAGGLSGVMAGGIIIALFNVLLTAGFVRRILNLYSPWLLGFFAVYVVLLFAHPQFYWEHRHDLPAELSYLFLLLSLLAWTSWIQLWKVGLKTDVSKGKKYALLAAAAGSAVLFAFAKETYFLSALCLVFGLALAGRAERPLHFRFLGLLAAVECASIAWTRHLNSPFVGASTDANSSYNISFAPSQVAATYVYYLYHLLNPALVLLVGWALVSAWSCRRQFILTSAIVLAGLTALATHATLPNHKFEEYAWAAAPLLLAPVLMLYRSTLRTPLKALSVALACILCALAIDGPSGYRERYDTPLIRWMVGQDQRGRAMADSLPRLRTIQPPARVLVTGLDNPQIPWQVADFIRLEFGDRTFWAVLLPPAIQSRRNSRVARFPDLADVRLTDFDDVAAYDETGNLASLRPVRDIPASDPLTAVLVPSLVPLIAASRAQPHDYGRLLRCAETSIEWGLWQEAAEFLEKAKGAGAGGDSTFERLSSELRTQLQQSPRISQRPELTAQPVHIIQPDGSGLGATELSWRVPDGVLIEIHVDAPNGPLLTAGEKSGHTRTGKWVKNGSRFFLQDVTAGKPLTPENTLASVQVDVTPQ